MRLYQIDIIIETEEIIDKYFLRLLIKLNFRSQFKQNCRKIVAQIIRETKIIKYEI